MNNQSLILGELREFKRAALERLGSLEARVESLQKSEFLRKGKTAGLAIAGSILGSAVTLLAAYLWR
jgi:hypothetical protein